MIINALHVCEEGGGRKCVREGGGGGGGERCEQERGN